MKRSRGSRGVSWLFDYRIGFFPRISVAPISSPTSPQVADDIIPPIVASCPVTGNNPAMDTRIHLTGKSQHRGDTTLLFRVSLFLPRCLSEIGYLQLYVTFSTILFPFYSDSVFRVPCIVVPCHVVPYSCRESRREWTTQEPVSLREPKFMYEREFVLSVSLS